MRLCGSVVFPLLTRSCRRLVAGRIVCLSAFLAVLCLSMLHILRFEPSTKVTLNRACGEFDAVSCFQQTKHDDSDVDLVLGNHIYVNTSLPIINPHPFDYVVNCPNACDVIDSISGNVIFLLNYVHTAVDHFARRDRIRRTWGSEFNYRIHYVSDVGTVFKIKVRTIFILGLSVKRPYLQPALEAEARLYGDIVQENFADTYRNLTYKAIAALRWVVIHCKRADYILKADDDVFVNIFNLQRRIFELYSTNIRSRLLLCQIWSRAPVARGGKWGVSRTDRPASVYPNYCAGLAYIQTGDVARALYRMSLRISFFWIDDVYVTGLLVESLGGQVKLTNTLSSYCGRTSAHTVMRDQSKLDRITFAEVNDDDLYASAWKRLVDKNSAIPFENMNISTAGVTNRVLRTG